MLKKKICVNFYTPSPFIQPHIHIQLLLVFEEFPTPPPPHPRLFQTPRLFSFLEYVQRAGRKREISATREVKKQQDDCAETVSCLHTSWSNFNSITIKVITMGYGTTPSFRKIVFFYFWNGIKKRFVIQSNV